MEPKQPKTSKKPFGRSLSDFLPLKPGEQKLLKACRLGRLAVLSHSVPWPLPLLAPVQALGPVLSPQREELVPVTEANCVRADFLRFLLLGGDEQAPVHERGVNLRGAYVDVQLNLSGCSLAVNVNLTNCFFSEPIVAQDAQLNGVLSLQGSHLVHGLKADRLHCSSTVFLSNGFRATGQVRFLGAQIGGNLNCKNGQFNEIEDGALLADGAVVKGDVQLCDGFKATEYVSLQGMQIGGNLDCTGGVFDGNGRNAFLAEGLDVRGGVNLCDGFSAKGEVSLIGSLIGGDLLCRGGRFEGSSGDALSAERINVKGSVYFCDGFQAKGMVILLGSQISGNLNCYGGLFEVPNDVALLANRLDVKNGVNLCRSFKATGEVRLLGAQIGGDLDCTDGQFAAVNSYALCIESAVVRGVLHLKTSEQPMCINVSHAEVSVLVDDLAAWGPKSTLDGFRYGSFGGLAATSGKARLEWLSRQPKAHLEAANFRPQPWRQLQRVLREMGHTEDAKQVGIALEDHLREIGRRGQFPKDPCELFRHPERAMTFCAHYWFGKLAGYGYRPVRLVSWMFAAWLICAGFYWGLAQPPFNAIAPSDPLVFQNPNYSKCKPHQSDPTVAAGNWPSCTALPGEYSTFDPLFYSLDLLLPVVDLGQEKAWGAYIPSVNESAVHEPILNWRWGYVVRFVGWFETLFGWISSLLLVAIISGFSRRNDES